MRLTKPARLVKLLLLACCLATAHGQPQSKAPEDDPIAPYLSWSDLRALYPISKHIPDWDYPKLKSIPNEQELIARCSRDLERSIKGNPDPFNLHHALPPGKLRFWSLNSDPDTRLIYFFFSYDSELINDLFIVYYYDPKRDRFILKSTR